MSRSKRSSLQEELVPEELPGSSGGPATGTGFGASGKQAGHATRIRLE